MSPWSVEKGTEPPIFADDPEYELVASANRSKMVSHEERIEEVKKRLKDKAVEVKEKFVKLFVPLFH